MILSFEVISKYAGMFGKCTVEPCPSGLCVYDKHGKYIGIITENGFQLYKKYKYSGAVERELRDRSIDLWDDEIAEMAKVNSI